MADDIKREISELKNDVAALEEKYLLDNGWKYTCYDDKDGNWYWSKSIITFTAPTTEIALAIQEALNKSKLLGV